MYRGWLIDWLIDWLTDCMVLNDNGISVTSRRPVHLSMLSWSSFNQYNIFSSYYCRNNGHQRDRNESCRNVDYQSSERILAETGIESATSCSQVWHITNWAMGLSLWRIGFVKFANGQKNLVPTTSARHVGTCQYIIGRFRICLCYT